MATSSSEWESCRTRTHDRTPLLRNGFQTLSTHTHKKKQGSGGRWNEGKPGWRARPVKRKRVWRNRHTRVPGWGWPWSGLCGFPDQSGLPDRSGMRGLPDRSGICGLPEWSGLRGLPERSGLRGLPERSGLWSGLRGFPERSGLWSGLRGLPEQSGLWSGLRGLTYQPRTANTGSLNGGKGNQVNE